MLCFQEPEGLPLLATSNPQKRAPRAAELGFVLLHLPLMPWHRLFIPRLQQFVLNKARRRGTYCG